MTVIDLRQKYPVFNYKSTNWQVKSDQFQANFIFSAGEHTFQHHIVFACDQGQVEKCKRSMIDQLVFSLGLVEMLSYWKAFCSPVIRVEAGDLSSQQIQWWQKLLINGMGEYFFVNQIDFTTQDFVKIVAKNQNNHVSGIANSPIDHSNSYHIDPTPSTIFNLDQQPAFLIPIGGGKDSIVTLELLKQFTAQQSISTTQSFYSTNQPSDYNYQQLAKKITPTINLESDSQPSTPNSLSLLLVNPTQAAREVADHANLPTIIVDRQLDPYLLDLNKQGYLNGHVPFSASLAFISVLVAYIHLIDQVVLSNEASANEASLTYLNRPINHQYSKSFAFERDFREYLTSITRHPEPTSGARSPELVSGSGFVSGSSSSGSHELVDQPNPVPFSSPLLPTYFSLLRPLNELQIARLFAKIGQPYFSIFRSCNRGSKTNTWCGDCPKCLFAYLMLAPWLDESTMISIFGQNLLDKRQLLPMLHALIGTTDRKPLECVGLREESLVACYLIMKQYQKRNHKLPTLVTLIKRELDKQVDLPTRSNQLLNNWNTDHHLPASLDQFLHDFLQ